MSAAGATHTSLRILARPHLAGSLPATASSPSATSDAPRSSRGKFVRRASSSSPSVMEEALNAPSSSLAIESVAYQVCNLFPILPKYFTRSFISIKMSLIPESPVLFPNNDFRKGHFLSLVGCYLLHRQPWYMRF